VRNELVTAISRKLACGDEAHDELNVIWSPPRGEIWAGASPQGLLGCSATPQKSAAHVSCAVLEALKALPRVLSGVS